MFAKLTYIECGSIYICCSFVRQLIRFNVGYQEYHIGKELWTVFVTNAGFYALHAY